MPECAGAHLEADCDLRSRRPGEGRVSPFCKQQPARKRRANDCRKSGLSQIREGNAAMTDNIVSTISRFLTPELIGKMASAAGLDRAMAPKATAATVPAILSGLAGVAGRPGGARQLASAVAEQPTDLLGGLANMLSGSAQIADKGNSLLSSLLGGGMSGLLASTLAKFLGIGEGPMRTMMGLLAPVIMGLLGREQRAQGLDSTGLARLLTGQKEEIAAAMPAGLNRLLEASGFHDGAAI